MPVEVNCFVWFLRKKTEARMKRDDDDTVKGEGGSSKDKENEPEPSTSTAGPSSPDSSKDALFEVKKKARRSVSCVFNYS